MFFSFLLARSYLRAGDMSFLCFLISFMVFSTRLCICSTLRNELYLLIIFMKVPACWCISYVCNKLPPNLAAKQQTCHTAAEGPEGGSSLAGWFSLRVFPEVAVKLLRAAVTSRIDWGCFQAHSRGCWHIVVPHWLLARGFSSSPVGGLLLQEQKERPRENLRGKPQAFIT